MSVTAYFPEGIAQGNAFINRIAEREQLMKRIEKNQHTVLMAPRRYGKTSLVMKVNMELAFPYATLDLLAAYSEEYIRDQLLDKLSQLLFQLLPTLHKGQNILLTIFKKMKPEISLGAFGQRLHLHFSEQPLKDITELLLKCDETAGHFKKRAVIFLDEFQQISQLKNGHAIEAAIRHAVERSKNIAYVFSGSNRRLLNQMFADNARPLYRLCQMISLERMEESVYVTYLQKCAKKRWGNALPESALQRIFFLTEYHPFYMNVLSQALWDRDSPKSASDVDDVWHEYVKTQRQMISYDIGNLSTNQKKLLVMLAKQSVKAIQSAEFVSLLKMPTSSAQQALDVLSKNDLVFQDKEGFYRVLDPAMKYYLNAVL